MFPLDQNPRSKKPTTIIGAIAFIVLVVIIIMNAGFVNRGGSPDGHPFKPFLGETGIWILTVALGLFGGIMLDPRQYIIMGITGTLTAIIITGFTLFYISFRSSILNIEFIVPLLVGLLVGRGIYLLLNRIFVRTKTES